MGFQEVRRRGLALRQSIDRFSLSPWERAGVRGLGALNWLESPLTLTLSRRERELGGKGV